MAGIDTAMRRSLREGFAELMVRSLEPVLKRQDLQGQVDNVRNAFSSWDNCMEATYCKWPVIALMIIGGLIIFSVVWCIIRCACCGLSCCCECFSCLKCCGNCCGCCDPPRGKRHKYLDEPYIPPNQGYKMQPPMNPHFPPVIPTMTPAVVSHPTGVSTGVTAGPPQYAEFDVSKSKGGDDALPAMPSWEQAGKKKVLVEEEEVEMDQLKKPEASGQNGPAMTGAAAIPGRASPAGSPGANRSPYGPPAGAPGANGYFPASNVENDPYAQNNQGYNQPGGGYSQASNLGDQGYGVAGAAMGQGRRSPYNDNGYNNNNNHNGYTDNSYGQSGNGGYNQPRGYDQPPARQGSFNTQAGYDNYDNYNATPQGSTQGYGMAMNNTNPRRSPPNELAGDNPYNNAGYSSTPVYGQDRRSPGPQQAYARSSPAPQQAYGGSPYDNNNNNSYDNNSQYSDSRPLRAPPQRQYSRDPNPVVAPVAQHAQSDAGFDFGTSGYTRPQANYRQPSPVQTQGQGQGSAAYPGYKPYSPPPNGGQSGNGW
ncbi:hypothetical protein OQA88_3590 [Cercophora sp. LCS_1]